MDHEPIAPRFWELVNEAEGSPSSMEQILTRLSKEDLARFYIEFCFAENFLDRTVSAHVPEKPGFLDSETLGCLIAYGKTFFDELIADPSKVMRICETDIDGDANYGGLAIGVYEMRFREDVPSYMAMRDLWPRG